MIFRRIALACGLFLAMAAAGSAPAANSIAGSFTRTSAGESLDAVFTDAVGGPTSGSYSGFVEILVGGVLRRRRALGFATA